MFQAEQRVIDQHIREYCASSNLPDPGAINWTPLPFSGEWGISTNFFPLAAAQARRIKETIGQGTNVPQLAQEIASAVAASLGQPAGFSHIEAVRGYLNLYFPTSDYARRIVDEVLLRGIDFGRHAPKDETVMVEYAQPNMLHSFHIGHHRNAILGEVLARLVQFYGFKTIRASYPGDIGLGVITVLWAYDRFYKGQEPEGVHERGQWLLRVYVEATKLLGPKENETPEEKALRESYELERRDMLRKWDTKDPYVRDLWMKLREWSLEELHDIMRIMDIKIDVWFYESEVDEPSKQIVDELIARGIADDERPQGGAVIVKIDEKLGLTKEKYRTNVILRSDGTTLYLTKDLALAKVKFEKYHVDRSIYVVDVRQSLHLQQAFAILRLWGFPQAEKCFHLGYGFVSLPEGAMSARRGRLMLFKDVMDEAVRRVHNEIDQKNPDLPAEERREVAEAIGLGAMAYAMLAVDNTKDIVFDIEAALNFDGRTGPYIQNAHVRAASILKKSSGLPAKASFDYPLTPHEVQLIDRISRFPAAVEQAALEYRPLVMATFAYDLASTFHSFYHSVPVLQADSDEQRAGRLRLVAAAKQTLANALTLLGITAPEVM